jgi:hypothetical protein
MSLIKAIKDSILSNQEEHKVKDSFWCTDYTKDGFELYHSFIGTPQTNPMEPEKLLMFSVAKHIETSIVNVLSKMGKGKPQVRIEKELAKGIKLTGYADFVFDDGIVVEWKSFYGDYQSKDLENGKPKKSYVFQLGCYLWALDKPKGILGYLDRGLGTMYEFEVNRVGTVVTCNGITIDLQDKFNEWIKLYNDHVITKVEPTPKFIYKVPVEQVDWMALPKAKVSKARNNEAVVGGGGEGWEIQYSSFKNLYIQREATRMGKTFQDYIGYSPKELERIKELSAGFTSKK